jgi:hypothetical protein
LEKAKELGIDVGPVLIISPFPRGLPTKSERSRRTDDGPQEGLRRIQENDEAVEVQLVGDDGEVVIGRLRRFAWTRGPKVVQDDINERLRTLR